MRICMLTRAVLAHNLKGGMELHAEMLRQGLSERGHQVTVITTPHPQGITVLSDAWGETHFVGNDAPASYSPHWWTESLKTLFKLHSASPFDVVAGHGKAAYAYLGTRSRLAAEQRLPVVVITHNNIICDFQQQLSQCFHRPLSVLRWMLRGIALYADDLRRLRHAECITALSELTGQALRQWFLLDPARIAVILNGINLATLVAGEAQRQRIRQRLGIADDTWLILAVGRLVPDKGHRYLIDALTRAEVRRTGQSFRLVLVGDGPLRNELQAQARSRGLEQQITFAGLLPHDEVPGWLWAADIAVLPSLAEGLPLSLLEAMACGRPVIASRVGAVANVLKDGVSGLLVHAGQPASLASALAELLSNRILARQLGERAQSYARASFDQQRMIEQFEQVFLQAARPAHQPT